MTRRLTISLPEDVAAELDDLPAGQVSGFIAEALRRRRISDSARAALSAAGHREFPFDPSGAQQRLAGGPVDAQTRDAAVTNLAALSGRDRDMIIEQLRAQRSCLRVVTAPAWVLDTGALVAFAHGVDRVGQLIADAADAEAHIAVPVTCLVEAYRVLDHTEHELLGPLRANDVIVTVPVDVEPQSDAAPMVGAMARHTGRLGAAHAVYTALTAAAGVVTSNPEQVRVILGKEWHIVEI